MSLDPLYWEASYAIARALVNQHPVVDLTEVSLEMTYQWVIALDNFADDPALATDDILFDIYQNWLEEVLEADTNE